MLNSPALYSLLFALISCNPIMAGSEPMKEPVLVDDKAVTLGSPESAPSVLGFGVKSSSHFTEGSAFIVEPLWDDLGKRGTMGGSIFFAEPYFSWGEEGEISASLGLGFRHLFSSQPQADAATRTSAGLLDEGLFIGANVFVDYLSSRADSDLWQLGLGAEAGTRYFEVRGNYYIPLGEGERVDRFDFTTLEPHINGGQLTSLTARSRTIDVIEEPMEGWDAEVAVLVPGLDRWFDVRLIAGYFEFYGDNGGAVFSSADISGWKAGIEVRPVPAVVLSATWYEDEAFVDNNWMFGLRLEIPLGKPGSFTPRRRHLQERLVEPVHRQNASINVGVTTEQVGPTRVTQINNAAEFASFVSNVSEGSSGGLIVLTSTGGGGGTGSSGATTISGGTLNVSNGSGLTKTGESALILNGPNTLTGGTLILGTSTLATGGVLTFSTNTAPGGTLGSGALVIGGGLSSFTIPSTFNGTITFPALFGFTSLVLQKDVNIGGTAVPLGTYPVSSGSINVGGATVPLGGATVTP